MTNQDQVLIHHLTTSLGAIQVTEGSYATILAFENTTAGFDIQAYRSLKHDDVTGTTAWLFNTGNLRVIHTKRDDMPDDPYQHLVSLEFGSQTGNMSIIHIYMDPEEFKQAVNNMMESTEIPANKGEEE
jgi:hypothetical protein